MKRILFSLIALVLIGAAVVGAAARPAQAQPALQDAMMTHTCDSTLIALLYVAEYNYGFHSMMDTASFDKGQYAPLFDAMMAMMPMMDNGMMATEEAMMGGDMMATEEPMMGGDMMMTMLVPGNIAGEDEACTALRAEVEAFLYGALTEGMMMESGS